MLAVRRLSESTFVLRVEREGFPALAGQCCTVGVVGSGVNREYSLYSGGEDPWFEFLVREVEDGLVSPALGMLRPGDEVELDGPYGRFVLERPGTPPAATCSSPPGSGSPHSMVSCAATRTWITG